jgi:porin
MDRNDKDISGQSPRHNLAPQRHRTAFGPGLGRSVRGLAAALSGVVVLAMPATAQEVDAAASGPDVADPAEDWRGVFTLSGKSGDAPTPLSDLGIIFKSKITQFVQGQAAGDEDGDLRYGGKADLMMRADLGKLGFWDGL